MNKEKQIEEIQQFATDLRNVSAKVSAIIMEETHEFLSGNHKYNSLKDFHEAHPKGRNLMEAEFLTELGYRKTSDVAREVMDDFDKELHKLADRYHEQGKIEYFTLCEIIYQLVIAKLKKKYMESEKDNGN